jgi:hypothetical protein
MRRELPSHPHVDHLKKQAKELLAAHRRGDPAALARIRAALPAFAGKGDEALAAADFALHDAQSAIAREHGFRSWRELRSEVESRRARVAAIDPAAVAALLRGHPNAPLPDGVLAAVRSGWPGGDAPAVALPAVLPLVALRSALLAPGAVVPIHVGRPVSIAALEAAAQGALATFPQRDPSVEALAPGALHEHGCLAMVVASPGGGFVVLRGLRWIALEALEAPDEARPYWRARVAAADPAAPGDGEAPAIDTLAVALRDRARALAARVPEAEPVVALLDSIEEPARLADLVLANLPAPVDARVAAAAAPTIAGRLRATIVLCDTLLRA